MGLRKIILDDDDFALILKAIEGNLNSSRNTNSREFRKLWHAKERLIKQLEIAGDEKNGILIKKRLVE